jgi:HlyD family secretion protein
MKAFVRILFLLLLGAGGVGLWYWSHREEPFRGYRTKKAEQGNLVVTIGATGTIQPEDVIDVGAQIAGMIESLGPDPNRSDKTIDYGSNVEEGTVLAQIDDSIYKTQVAQAKATLARAEADLLQLEARLYQREREWNRMQQLSALGKSNVTESTFDAAKADYEAAKAALAVGEAEVASARAMLEQAEVNLRYTTIKSPVRGVIIDRRVNVGQTVVASLNAPSLFLIAKDLHRLEVWAAVNEADIGRIRPGQPVVFTVDAFPGEKFRGEVVQTRLNATMTQNVVTYTVVVSTDNSSGKLLPYLTANLNFEVGRRTDVLLVPNAALRWRPKPEQIAPDWRQRYAEPVDNSTNDREARGVVWTPAERFVRPIALELGMTDDSQTEVMGGELTAGTDLVVGENEAADDSSVTTSPFTPQFRAPRR